MRYLVIIVLLLIGCNSTPLPAPLIKIPAPLIKKKLAIVIPHEWMEQVTPYVEYKKELGFNVSIVDVDEIKTRGDFGQWGFNLRNKLISLEPDYVFLVGDTSVVPTIYSCGDVSSWSDWTEQSCIYSDFYLSLADDNLTVLFPVGRLLAKKPIEVNNYLFKAKKYNSLFGSAKGAYLINDRAYDDTDATVLSYSKRLYNSGIMTLVEVLNSKDDVALNSLNKATYMSLQSAVNNNAGFIMYYGHGSSWGWGYYGNLLWPYLSFEESKPVPLVYAMACETALSAPNAPWYPYYDSLGNYKDFSNVKYVNAMDIGTVSSLQFHEPIDVISDNIARHFTSTGRGGAMVYIGETVVTHAALNFNDIFYEHLIKAAKNGVETIGDIWYNTIKNMPSESKEKDVHPQFFQFVGDPTVFYPKITE